MGMGSGAVPVHAQGPGLCAAGEDHGPALHGAVVGVQGKSTGGVSGQAGDGAKGNLGAGVHGLGAEPVAQFQSGDSRQAG